MTLIECNKCGTTNGPFTIIIEGPIGYHFCPECYEWAVDLRAKAREQAKKWYWRFYWRLSKAFRRLKFRVGYKFYQFKCIIFRRTY